MVKSIGKSIVSGILEWQVKRLRARNSFAVVAVAGSVGKTSTKLAVADVLSATNKVRWQEGNYNDRTTVPLIFFGHKQPHILNPFAWAKVFWQNERIVRKTYPFDAVVIELGTDHPGDLSKFSYIKPDLAIVTAVAPEHMEYFGSLDAVAKEELSVLNYAKQTLINIDDTPTEYLTDDKKFVSYGLQQAAAYRIERQETQDFESQTVTYFLDDEQSFDMNIPLLGDQGAKISLAAAAAGHMLGMPLDEIKQGLAAIDAFAGRMQILPGIKNSTIIDDTYNASPSAVKAALDVLQSGDAPQRIAIMGSMNELGAHSPQAHREVGAHCDPTKLNLVVTIGADAAAYLAPVARHNGCRVETFINPFDAGDFVRDNLQDGAVVLAKGSQNGVFAEESLKPLLADQADAAKLVRQSPAWIKFKQQHFIR